MVKKFLDKINKYFEKKKNKIKKYNINEKENYKFKFEYDKNKNSHLVEIYDKKLNLKIKAEYDTVGIYNIMRKVWYWAWNISMIDLNLSKNSLKIKELKNDILKNYNKYDSKELDILHYYVDNDNFMTNYNKTDLLSKIALYYLQGDFIFKVRRGLDEIDKNEVIGYEIEEFICIKNIKKIG